MNDTLKKKRALVTGGSRGIGAAIVKRLAREGADVVTYTSSPEQADKVVHAAQELGIEALAIQADSADASAVVAEEVAGMVAYLAGSEAGFITGASLMIDGGFSA